MTTTQTALDRAAEAMEAELADYRYADIGLIQTLMRISTREIVLKGTLVECRALIARQAFAAGLKTLIAPVPKDALEEMADEIGAYREFENENFMGANDLDREAAQDAFTAAINEILKGEV